MENPSSPPPLSNVILLSGPSGSGKTTLAKALQEALLPSVWLGFSVDSIIYSLPESVLERCNRQNDWTGVDGPAVFSGALACLRALTATGNSVIFDVVISSGKAADQILSGMEDANPFMVGLTCTWKEIKRRTVARGDRTIGEAALSFQNAAGHLRNHLEIDTSRLTPEEAAAVVAEEFHAWNRSQKPG